LITERAGTGEEKPLYVGQTGDLRRRIYSDHLHGNEESSIMRKHLRSYLGAKTEHEIAEPSGKIILLRLRPLKERPPHPFYGHAVAPCAHV